MNKCYLCQFLSSSLARASGFDSVLPSGPDIAQFKQGVKTVAGKMAVLANGVMNTIQVRYLQGELVLPILVDVAPHFPVSTGKYKTQHIKAIKFTEIIQITLINNNNFVFSGSLRFLLSSLKRLGLTCGMTF